MTNKGNNAHKSNKSLSVGKKTLCSSRFKHWKDLKRGAKLSDAQNVLTASARCWKIVHERNFSDWAQLNFLSELKLWRFGNKFLRALQTLKAGRMIDHLHSKGTKRSSKVRATNLCRVFFKNISLMVNSRLS